MPPPPPGLRGPKKSPSFMLASSWSLPPASVSISFNPLNNFSFLVGSQIKYLVCNLNKKNFKSSVAEIHHLIDLYGHDAFLFLLRSLFSTIDFQDQKGKDSFRLNLLNQEMELLTKQPNFSSCLCQCLEEQEDVTEEFLSRMCQATKLNLHQALLLGLGLTHSVDSSLKQEGVKFLKSKLADLTQSTVKTLPHHLLHHLLYFLQTNEGFGNKVQTIIKALQKSNTFSPVLIPLFSETEKQIATTQLFCSKNWADSDLVISQIAEELVHVSTVMEDLSYPCCATHQNLKDIFSEFPKIDEQDIAKIIGMMARTHSDLVDGCHLYRQFPAKDSPVVAGDARSWDINVFVEVVQELFPTMNWNTILSKLDYPEFQLFDSKGVQLIVSIYRKALADPFPVDFLFETWKNASGQLSFLKFAVSLPLEIINFANHPNRAEVEKLPSLAKYTGTVAFQWTSLSLIETLFRLAETENYGVTRSIFNYPLKHCPELLILAMSQAKSPYTALSLEISSTILHVLQI